MTLNLILLFLIIKFHLITCEEDECSKTICNPRAGDLLIGRESFLRASSTCGLYQLERFCVVTASDSGKKSKCDVCDSKDPYQEFSGSLSHRIENLVSRLPQNPKRWWQSSSGVHNVTIEISFESEFQFTFTQLRFKTYRPAAMFIERSKDYGHSWTAYAYFSENCAYDFPSIPKRKRNSINDIVCTSEFSSISPSEGGTVLFSADTGDWFSDDVFWNKKRNDVTVITNLRVNFKRLHTLGDWKIDDNPNIRNKYYYAVSEWIIRGRCSCYGHASRCTPKEGQTLIKEMVYGVCECQHNTIGQNCEKCKDFYNNSPWRPADRNSINACTKCECNNHSNRCHFDQVVYVLSRNKAGGVCDDCQHNTEGTNCEKCKIGFYRNSLVSMTSEETCLKCQCSSEGTKHPEKCYPETDMDSKIIAGHCICKENVEGVFCDRCKVGFFKFSGDDEKGCLKCKCLMIGTLDNRGCDSSNGNCYCKANVIESDCSSCKNGFFNLTESNPDGCTPCACSEHGSVSPRMCNKINGQCNCKEGYTGKMCHEIKAEWFVEKPNYPLKVKEEINIELPPVSTSGYYNFIITMDTQQMQILDSYIIILTLDHSKKSACPPYQDTLTIVKDTKNIVVANKCLEKDIPITITVFTIDQPSDKFLPPSIVDIIVIPIIDVNSTKTRNVLADCIKIKTLPLPKPCEFLNTKISTKFVSNKDPRKCMCNVTGSSNNKCNKDGGQCLCLPNVTGRKCDRCLPNSYGFDARGCKSCNCNLNGSLNLGCGYDTGKCLCRSNVEGQHCNSCKPGFWNFPFCDSCKCNNMADTCDQRTGKCINCRGYSFGFSCHQCQNGYYGEPGRGVPCSKCSCPGLSDNRNNSIGCSLIFNTTNYLCHCKSGYVGQYCDQCDINHFGNPLGRSGGCIPCRCSNNINPTEPNSCDSRTGECLKCLYNTAGFNCEKCAPGYFGNGVLRTCKKCVCNELGTNFKSEEVCNHETGKCTCLPNVIGHQCDQCKDNFFNISSKIGCLPCQCDYPNGAINKSCNALTGQCDCHSTRSGLRCDKCEDGYWGSPKNSWKSLKDNIGCQRCECDSLGSQYKQCDRNTGACRCKEGITGRFCDRCKKGTDGKMPNCMSCGDCWLQWDNAIESVENSINISTAVNITSLDKMRYPTDLKTAMDKLENLLSLLSETENIFSKDLLLIINDTSLKLSELKLLFENVSITNFDAGKFGLTNLINLINLAEQSVSQFKIQDIGGASNEIKKVRDSILDIKSKADKLFKNISVSSESLVNNKNLSNFITETRPMEKFDQINKTFKFVYSKLDNFNTMTCHGEKNIDLLNCSTSCDSIGCQPRFCFRELFKNTTCSKNPIFFNAIAWYINSNSNWNISFQKKIQEVKRKIKTNEDQSSEDMSDIVIVQNFMKMFNNQINMTHEKIEKQITELQNKDSKVVSEAKFQSIINKINNFSTSFNYEEAFKLQETFNKRKDNLTDNSAIIQRSAKNQAECEILKKNALKAKQDVDVLLNSFNTLSGPELRNKKFSSDMGRALPSIDKNLDDSQRNLQKISGEQKKVKQTQGDVIQTNTKTSFINEEIRKQNQTSNEKLNSLDNDQQQEQRILKSIKENIEKIEGTRNATLREKESLDIRIFQEFQKLKDKVLNLGLRIKESREKIAETNAVIKERKSKLEILGTEIDQKLNRISILQEKIYLKSEHHSTCLP